MDKNYLNKKWLEGSLTDEEQSEFDKIDDNALLKKIIDKAPVFSASNFSEVKGFETLQSKIKAKKSFSKKRNWIKPFYKIAAVLVLIFGLYFVFNTTNSNTIETEIGEQKFVQLPDASKVTLNAVSEISFNDKSWEKKRELKLDGEAFFKVEKGSTFDVNTEAGTVRVVGTQFNVKQRKNIFEVTCFEGVVAVTYGSETLKLLPGNMFSVINGKISSEMVNNMEKPLWIDGTSYFKKVPFSEVVKELERQYKVAIKVNSTDENLIFTGGFTHKNLNEALESITAPLKLIYKFDSPTKISLHHSE